MLGQSRLCIAGKFLEDSMETLFPSGTGPPNRHEDDHINMCPIATIESPHTYIKKQIEGFLDLQTCLIQGRGTQPMRAERDR